MYIGWESNLLLLTNKIYISVKLNWIKSELSLLYELNQPKNELTVFLYIKLICGK